MNRVIKDFISKGKTDLFWDLYHRFFEKIWLPWMKEEWDNLHEMDKRAILIHKAEEDEKEVKVSHKK